MLTYFDMRFYKFDKRRYAGMDIKTLQYVILYLKWKGYGRMFVTQVTLENEDTKNLVLYRLIAEGYKAIQEGRTCTIEEVRENLEKRREHMTGEVK